MRLLPCSIALCAVLPFGAIRCARAPAEDFVRAPVEGPKTPDSAVNPGLAPSPPTVLNASAIGLAGRCVALAPRAPPKPVAPGPAPGCPSDPEPNAPAAQVVPIAFPDVSGVAVSAELVRSEHDTERGLMYRKAMAEDHGMLFDLRVRDIHRFWMHNTCIPLDMIFTDEDGLIVGVVEYAPTLDDGTESVDCPSRWVLEVNAGWARRHGVRAGQKMALPAP